MSTQVYEHPWVGVLMDVGARRHDIEETAQKFGKRWYGEDMSALDHWCTIRDLMDWQALPKDGTKLRSRLLTVSAELTAWIEDIDRNGSGQGAKEYTTK